MWWEGWAERQRVPSKGENGEGVQGRGNGGLGRKTEDRARIKEGSGMGKEMVKRTKLARERGGGRGERGKKGRDRREGRWTTKRGSEKEKWAGNRGASRSCSCSVAQSLSRVRLSTTPWTAARQASLSFTVSWNLLRLMSIESVVPSNHPILCRPLSLCLQVRGKKRGKKRCRDYFP